MTQTQQPLRQPLNYVRRGRELVRDNHRYSVHALDRDKRNKKDTSLSATAALGTPGPEAAQQLTTPTQSADTGMGCGVAKNITDADAAVSIAVTSTSSDSGAGSGMSDPRANETALNPRYSVPPVPIARWVANLFPAPEIHTCISAAILLGARTNPELIMLPQLRISTEAAHYNFHPTFTNEELDEIWAYGNKMGLNRFTHIARTALYAGLQLPGWRTGDCTPRPHLRPIDVNHMAALLTKANVRPRRPELIPTDTYLDLPSIDAGVFENE